MIQSPVRNPGQAKHSTVSDSNMYKSLSIHRGSLQQSGIGKSSLMKKGLKQLNLAASSNDLRKLNKEKTDSPVRHSGNFIAGQNVFPQNPYKQKLAPVSMVRASKQALLLPFVGSSQ